MHVDEGTIHTWLDGELSTDEAGQLEAHIAQCPTCAAAVAEARGLVAASSRILGALDDVPAKVNPALAKGREAGIPRPRRRLWQHPQFAAAAAVMIMAAGSFAVLRRSDRSSVASQPVAEMDSASITAPPMTARAPAADPAIVAPLRQLSVSAAPSRADAPAAGIDSSARVAAAGEAAAVVGATGDSARVPVAEAAKRREALADSVVSGERQRLTAEQRVQLAAAPPTPVPAAAAVEKAVARNEVASGVSGRALQLSRDASIVPGVSEARCLDLRRSAAAVSAGVPAFVQLMEMAGPTIDGRELRLVVSAAGAGWHWYRAADGGVFLVHVVDGAIVYAVRVTGIGASDATGTERACVTR